MYLKEYKISQLKPNKKILKKFLKSIDKGFKSDIIVNVKRKNSAGRKIPQVFEN